MRSPFDLIQEQIVRLKDQLAGVPRFERGRITSVDPLRVQLDGADAPLAGQPDSLASGLRIGQYVQVMIYRHRATIIGAHAIDTGWIPMTLINGWTAHRPSFYRREGNKVHLSGAVRAPVESTPVRTFTTLPNDYRPTQLSQFMQAGSYANTFKITVGNNGNIYPDTGWSELYISLDGIYFFTD